jgi:3-oxoacyl-[acyl-carrier-protein] synthase-3
MKAAGILGVGKYVPPKILTNHDLVKMGLETSDEWIVERTGIRERRVCDDSMSASDMAFEAAQKALADAKTRPEEIDLIIVATTSPDYLLFPSTACLLQKRLGLKNIGAFDLSAACSGFNFALTTAAQFVQTGQAKKALVVASDCLSKSVDWTDRSVCILFGDGAGAVVLGEVESGYGILTSSMYSDGGEGDILIVKAGGSRQKMTAELLESKDRYIYMNGRAVFKVAIHAVVPAVQDAMRKANISAEQLSFYIPHQANLRLIEQTRERLGLRHDQTLTNVERYGNTSSASVPLVLAEGKEKGLFKKGDTIAMVGFGAGFTWGVNILWWAI